MDSPVIVRATVMLISVVKLVGTRQCQCLHSAAEISVGGQFTGTPHFYLRHIF